MFSFVPFYLRLANLWSIASAVPFARGPERSNVHTFTMDVVTAPYRQEQLRIYVASTKEVSKDSAIMKLPQQNFT